MGGAVGVEMRAGGEPNEGAPMYVQTPFRGGNAPNRREKGPRSALRVLDV